MHVLITGGCGFIGANLVAKLQQRDGLALRVLDNESLGRREHLEPFGGEFVAGDIRDPGTLDAALDGIDAVVHLAADTRVMDSIENPSRNFDVNVNGTLALLEAMRARGIRRLINASTGGAIVGEVEPPVHEGLVPRPASPYGASKLAVEGYCSAYSASYGLRALSLRFSNVYGPRSFHKGSVVAAFFRRILEQAPIVVYGDGTQVRDYVFVGDLCDGIIAALTSDVSGVNQLASGKPVRLNELIDAMRQVVAPREVAVEYRDFRAGEVYATYCDISKARRELNYDPRTTLMDGLADTWAWFMARSRA
jgi:UDP-glucose 4-epimerase